MNPAALLHTTAYDADKQWIETEVHLVLGDVYSELCTSWLHSRRSVDQERLPHSKQFLPALESINIHVDLH